jgi:hypothetical protein
MVVSTRVSPFLRAARVIELSLWDVALHFLVVCKLLFVANELTAAPNLGDTVAQDCAFRQPPRLQPRRPVAVRRATSTVRRRGASAQR